MRISLKIDVDTLRGTLEGVPPLVNLLQRHAVDATFLFSLGPDHTGRALRRIFRPGFLSKVRRTSVASNYGLKTLMYGVLLPGPDIGRRGATVMQAVRRAGFEVGIHTWDHVRWQDFVTRRDAAWTEREMERARAAFTRIFDEEPLCFGAAGWQINAHALALQDRWGLVHASDTRGRHPFLPSLDGRDFQTPQLPTTLPTLDELVGREGITADNAHEAVLDLSARADTPETGHVFTLHAELEGMAYIGFLDRLLTTWKERGCRIGSLGTLARSLDRNALPRHPIVFGEVEGRSGVLALQGP
ncbi:MAG: 4-deoxy-4-formamido-L-arabinose-phosphoundecaprenol deformylase [Gammaproteobacteria bacterium]|nr:MAG: 4-deoxy-4-formamido-L-arabinose-phosphoundecaprenol deformylase [Gammaproteobacteria bacterium]